MTGIHSLPMYHQLHQEHSLAHCTHDTIEVPIILAPIYDFAYDILDTVPLWTLLTNQLRKTNC